MTKKILGAVTGARVGEMLKALGSGRQVIVITHLHPVANLDSKFV